MSLPVSKLEKFELEVQGTAKDLGELQFGILKAISEERFDDGVQHLKNYKKAKGNHIAYVKRTDRLYKHIEDLIVAIEAKKTFPNISSLPQAKREELHQKTLENWEDLKLSLRRLRSVERDLAVNDARSSVWVIKAIVFCFTILISIFVINEGFRSFGKSATLFLDESAKMVLDLVGNIFN